MKYLSTLILTLLILTGCEDRGYGEQEISTVPSVGSQENMRVIKTIPDISIAQRSYINVEFSSFVELGSSSPEYVTLKMKDSSESIPLFVDSIENHLLIKPLAGLEISQTYILRIETSAKDIMGNSLSQAYIKEFVCKEDFWQSVEVGETHSMALSRDGDLYLWGSNSYKELLQQSDTTRSIPLGVSTTQTVENFSAGSFNTALVYEDATLQSIGFNALEDTQESDFKLVSVGNKHSTVIKNDGTLWSWGSNSSGQLGNLGVIAQTTLTQEATESIEWSSVSAGEDFSVGLKSDGTMWGWGNNEFGQIGNSAYNERRQAVQEDTNATNWQSISAGANHTSAIKSDGTLWSWGLNDSGELADASNISNRVATREDSNSTNWESVSCGYNHSVALKSDKTLWTWGNNYYGQLGDGSSINKNTPTQIAGEWESVSAGKYFTIAVKSDGTMWAWGYNADKQLGLGSNIDDTNIPTEIK